FLTVIYTDYILFISVFIHPLRVGWICLFGDKPT
ncbi:unnamed protein product, partial [Plutella xylostella]